MRLDCITKVKFHNLDTKRWDRRGTIATFHLRSVNNQKLIQMEALYLLWNLTSFLSNHFHARSAEEVDPVGYFSEGNDCWITLDEYENPITVRVRHKYWSTDQVKCFCQMVWELAKLHKWEIEDERLPH